MNEIFSENLLEWIWLLWWIRLVFDLVFSKSKSPGARESTIGHFIWFGYWSRQRAIKTTLRLFKYKKFNQSQEQTGNFFSVRLRILTIFNFKCCLQSKPFVTHWYQMCCYSSNANFGIAGLNNKMERIYLKIFVSCLFFLLVPTA